VPAWPLVLGSFTFPGFSLASALLPGRTATPLLLALFMVLSSVSLDSSYRFQSLLLMSSWLGSRRFLQVPLLLRLNTTLVLLLLVPLLFNGLWRLWTLCLCAGMVLALLWILVMTVRTELFPVPNFILSYWLEPPRTSSQSIVSSRPSFLLVPDLLLRLDVVDLLEFLLLLLDGYPSPCLVVPAVDFSCLLPRHLGGEQCGTPGSPYTRGEVSRTSSSDKYYYSVYLVQRNL